MDTNTTMETEVVRELFFGWLDLTLFILMLVISTMIGIYFGFWGKKEDTPKEYLHGGKTMSTLPVAVSLVASFISGIMVMGVPTEVYLYGTLYWWVALSIVFVGIITYYFYLPVFFDLQLTSTYEYLELRYNRSVRVMASVMSTIQLLLYVPIVVYVPALAFSQVSGMNVHFITPAISILCIFYTMLLMFGARALYSAEMIPSNYQILKDGGIKAVVWTDFLQGAVMVIASIAVIILGVVHIGGFGTVWDRSLAGGRIRIFEMNPSPFERLTFWVVVIGNSTNWIGSVAFNQAMVQKFLSLPTLGKARISLILFVIGLILVTFITCYTGLLIYATYHDCDPVGAKIVSRPDQILPYYVMDIAAAIPGLPGLFVAGIFSAALSTMSSSLNALGATLFEDFVRPCLKNKLTDEVTNNIIKCVVIIIGAICVLIVFVVDKLGSVLQLTLSVVGVTNGAMVGLFTFGMFYPRGNAKGALAGSICSMLIMGWIVFGTQKAMSDGRIKQPLLSSNVEGCPFNVTLPETKADVPEEEVFILYRIAFLYYTLLGMIILFVVGTIVSLLTAPPEEEKNNPALFTPIVRRYLERKNHYGNSVPAEKEFLNIIPDYITRS